MTTASSLAGRTAPRCVRAVTMTSPPATPIRPSSVSSAVAGCPAARGAGPLVGSRSTSGFCNRTELAPAAAKIRVQHGGKHADTQLPPGIPRPEIGAPDTDRTSQVRSDSNGAQDLLAEDIGPYAGFALVTGANRI